MPHPRRLTYPPPRSVGPHSNESNQIARARPTSSGAPPEYATLSVSTLPEYPSAEELDISNEVAGRTYGGASRPRRPRRAFVFKLGSTNSSPNVPEPWLTLRLMSNAPVSAQRPRYIGGEDVEGSVIMNFEKPQTVSSVSVMVRGRIVTSSMANGSHVFLEHVHSLWKHDIGASLPTNATPDGAAVAEVTKGKFRGKFEWVFSFPFPTEFSFLGKRKGSGPTTFSTPQTLMERSVNATIIYEVIVKVAAGLFRHKYKVIANVLYVPSLISPELPILRSEAYRTGSYLCSPLEDPEGWSALEPLNIRISARAADGTSGSAHSVSATCTVYIANPATYTRGTVIPCYLVCRRKYSDPRQAGHLLQAFISQECISLSLTRRIVYFRDAKQGASVVARDPTAVSSGKYSDLEDVCDESKQIGTPAVWWAPKGVGSAEYEERSHLLLLEGEMHLEPDLLPSCDIPFLLVSYTASVSLSQSQDLRIECGPVTPNGSAPPSPTSPASTRRTSRARFSRSVGLEGHGAENTEPGAPVRCTASHPITIVTVKANGPHPIGYMPRPVARKPDLSEVREMEFPGALIQ